MDLLAILLLSVLSSSRAQTLSEIGVNYGQHGNNLPCAQRIVEVLTMMKAGSVKLYDANPDILQLLSSTGLQVSIMVQNNEISAMAADQSIADEWVRNNVTPYCPRTQIRFLLVGNEVDIGSNTQEGRQMWLDLVPAMRRIKKSLRAQNITYIKVSTPLSMGVIQPNFPPSSGMFRPEVIDVIAPMLRFLDRTRSFFFIDVYPFFSLSPKSNNVSLDFALFKGNSSITDPDSGLRYTNLLDQMLDSIIFAMSRLGYPNIQLVIAETGWPNSGGVGEFVANIYNAATYNRNLIQRMTTRPPIGTPARPGIVIPTFLFSLFDENQKSGAESEKHWGLLRPEGTPIYEIDLTGQRPMSDFAPLPSAKNNVPQGKPTTSTDLPRSSIKPF